MSDDRQLSFLERHYKQALAAAVVAAPVMWFMNIHLDFRNKYPDDSSVTHGLIYADERVDKDIGTLKDKAMNASDRVTAAVTGKPLPPDLAQDNEQSAPPPSHRYRESPARQTPSVKVDVCVPHDLVAYAAWEAPPEGSKMHRFSQAVAAFIRANGDARAQYNVRNDAFENFDPAAGNANGLVDITAAGQNCPAGDDGYKLPLP